MSNQAAQKTPPNTDVTGEWMKCTTSISNQKKTTVIQLDFWTQSVCSFRLSRPDAAIDGDIDDDNFSLCEPTKICLFLSDHYDRVMG